MTGAGITAVRLGWWLWGHGVSRKVDISKTGEGRLRVGVRQAVLETSRLWGGCVDGRTHRACSWADSLLVTAVLMLLLLLLRMVMLLLWVMVCLFSRTVR